MDTVKVTTDNDSIHVVTPYHAGFVKSAKTRLGGRWNPTLKAWTFRAKDRDSVTQVLKDYFGTDGSTAIPTMDVLVTLGPNGGLDDRTDTIQALGRTIVKKYERDSTPNLSPGVSLYQGPDFAKSCGSRNNPVIGSNEKTRVLLVRDVPQPVALHAIKENPEVYKALPGDDTRMKLFLERASLIERLREIDAVLNEGEDNTPEQEGTPTE